MDIRRLRAFIAVAEELHFGRAARRLHISQPPLSNQIRKLEADLEVRLFDRTSRRVTLTEAGRALLGRAHHLVTELDRAADEARRVARGEGGTLSIAYTPTATYEILPRLLTVLAQRQPALPLELRELRSPDQVDAIREGRIEIGLACLPVEAPDLEVRTLARETLSVALPARHRLARRARVTPADLRYERFVIVRPDVEPAWARPVASALARHGVGTDVAHETDSKIAMLGLVSAGLGVSVVSSSMRALERRGVVMRPLTGLRLRLPIGWIARRAPTPRAAEVLAAARVALGRARAG